MATPVYKSFFVKFKDPWYQLSQAEQNDILKKLTEAIQKVGGKSHIVCYSAWSTEAWQFFGLEQYPSVEAEQEHSRILQELNWFRYCESLTALGTEFTAPQ